MQAREKLAASPWCYRLVEVALGRRGITNVEIERLENSAAFICWCAGLIQLWWAAAMEGHDVSSIIAEDKVQWVHYSTAGGIYLT